MQLILSGDIISDIEKIDEMIKRLTSLKQQLEEEKKSQIFECTLLHIFHDEKPNVSNGDMVAIMPTEETSKIIPQSEDKKDRNLH